MLALIYYPQKGLGLTEMPLPSIPPKGLVIKVMAAAICGSDARILKGEKEATPGIVLGHEVAGIVDATDSNLKGFSLGDPVVLFPSIFCGKCLYCQRGLTNLCTAKRSIGYRFNGGFAQYIAVPSPLVEEGGVVSLKGQAPWTNRALIEPLSCVLHSIERVALDKEGEYLIVGAGPMGLMHLLVLLKRGALRIFVWERNPKRRSLAKDLGEDRVEVLDPKEKGLLAYLGEERVDGAFLCARAENLIGEALRVLRKGGTLNLFAGYPQGTTVKEDPNLFHYGERCLTGTHSTTLSLFRQAALMVEEGKINLDPLVTHTFPLSEWRRAFQTYTSGEGLKVAFVPWQNP
jgi:L-iditol 2-dehydrogenase